MEHQSLKHISERAAVRPDTHGTKRLSRRDRLNRWADLLEAAPLRQLNTLRETEHIPIRNVGQARADNSPITVAFADRALRRDGLAGDSYGDARAFFGVTDHELHFVICYCHYGETVRSGLVASRIRRLDKAQERKWAPVGRALERLFRPAAAAVVRLT